MNRMLAVCLLLVTLLPHLLFSQSSYDKTKTGFILYPHLQYPGQPRAVRVEAVNDRIIRITASPATEFPEVKSLSVLPQAVAIPVTVREDAMTIYLETASLVVKADRQSGQVSFMDKSGKQMLAEVPGSRKLEPVYTEGEQTWSVQQRFSTEAGDAWYGLGQHQDGIMNYRGHQVFLFQNNTEVAIPFLVSKNNYGILWDNNSITRAGDTRDYQELSAFKLYDANGNEGWLTASYFNDRDQPGTPVIQKAESEISYDYLNDTKLRLPPVFKPEKGMVRWEGSIASAISGAHKLRVRYAGYMKVWLDGKLVLDRWRQAWNPGTATLDLPLEKNKKVIVKFEWMPDGGESYTSFKCQSPVTGEAADLGFVSEAGRQLDYYFIAGASMDEVISGYRHLTGKATLLPVWTMGLWQSRERYKTQDEILGNVEEFRKRKIPLDNIVLDWSYWKQDDWGSQEFDASRFPSPDSMIRVLHNKYKTRFMISVWPKFYEGIRTYNEFDRNGWLYSRNVADRQRDWIAQGYVSTFYDAFNEKAQKGFWELLHEKLYKKGVDAWWMDASEPDILSNVNPAQRIRQMYPLASGLTAEYLNAYPLMNAKGIYEGQRSVDANKRVFILTRSGFSGMQRYAAATWSGDISSRWHDMKNQISAGVNFSMSGLPYWSMDIGGFAVEPKYEKPSADDQEEWREMNTRWYQFGTFVPLFRVHGQFPFREIYNVAPAGHPAYKSMLYYDHLRYRLLPYIYSLAGQTYHNDYTIMRGLVMDFGKDEQVPNINDQYMFGPSLLISPVTSYKARTRNVYLPGDHGWYDLYDGGFEEGGRTIEAKAPYERMPVFVKSGSIIPFGPALQYTTEKKPELVTLYVYAGENGSFSLYEDDGLTYDYEKGNFSRIRFDYDDTGKMLRIGAREGSFPGMLTRRQFRIKYISKEKATPLDPDARDGILVTYTGKAMQVALRK